MDRFEVGCFDITGINDKVADLAKEVCRVEIPGCTVALVKVHVRREDAEVAEGLCGTDGGEVVGLYQC